MKSGKQIKPEGWPYTGRTYPEGAALHVFTTLEFHDLAWYDAKRTVWVYLSTKKREKE
jgi:hypothetical protein